MCRLEKEAEWKWKWESLLSGTEWVTSRQALYTSTVQTSDQTCLSRVGSTGCRIMLYS